MAKRSSASLLSAQELELWHAVKQLGERALSAVGSALEATTGLSGADFGVLSRLEDLGRGSLPQKELRTSLGWDKSRLSHQLTRMEARGLLARKPGGDGRAIVVELLATGRRAITAARPVHAEAVREHLLRHIQGPEAAALLSVSQRISKPR